MLEFKFSLFPFHAKTRSDTPLGLNKNKMTPARVPKQFVKENSARAQTFSHIQSKADSRRQAKTCTNRYRETRHKDPKKLSITGRKSCSRGELVGPRDTLKTKQGIQNIPIRRIERVGLLNVFCHKGIGTTSDDSRRTSHL